MPVLITSKFDKDLIKNDCASLETPFSHYKYMGNYFVFRCSSTLKANSLGSGPIWPKFFLVRDFMPVLVTCKFEKDLIKATEKKWRHHFLHYKSMGPFLLPWKPVLIESAQNILCSLSTPVMIKLDQDRLTCLRHIQVQKCGRRRRTIGVL